MLHLAAARSAGAHPYFVPVEHTAFARDILGPGPLLAPEVAVVLETDPHRARELARGYAATYLGLPNYTQNLRTLGFGDEDIDVGMARAAAVAAVKTDHQITIRVRTRRCPSLSPDAPEGISNIP